MSERLRKLCVVPFSAGAKVTVTEHFFIGASMAPQLLVCEKALGPAIAIPPKVTLLPPFFAVFVSSIFLWSLLPTRTLPKSSGAGAAFNTAGTRGAGVAVAVGVGVIVLVAVGVGVPCVVAVGLGVGAIVAVAVAVRVPVAV